MSEQFDYQLAFSRNIGWVTEDEQAILRTKRIAIAGMGGVGGSHLLTLVRAGISQFNLSDFDEFACENTNRQAGANTASYGKKKLDVMVEMAQAINPEVDIRLFPEGINHHNTEDFLSDVDCYVDSLDFFALEARKHVFKLCADKGIAATTAAPIGMGTAYLNFLPGKMSFEEYFRLEGYSEHEQYLRFFLGLTPAALQQAYLVDPSRLDLANKKGPSTMMGCQLASGVAGSQVLKILLNRGKVLNVPWGLHFDAYTNQFKKTWRPGGNNNPIQRLAFNIGKKKLLGNLSPTATTNTKPLSLIEKILDYARWAPSGDNMQAWQFEIINETSFIIHGTDTREHCVYDLDGHSSHLAHGILLETIAISASQFGLNIESTNDFTDPQHIKITVNLVADESIKPNTLLPYVKIRAVQRRAMGTRPLSESEKAALENALPEGFSVTWFESFDDRLKLAKLNFCNAKTRLTMKEAFHTHKNIIDWHQQFSETKIPEKALGVDWATARLMQWLFKDWKRIEIANKYFAGTLMPRIQLDFIPSLKSCAHFAIQADKEASSIEDYVNAGRAIQRFWLTTAKLGLGFQPEQTPVIFAKYLRQNIEFSQDEAVVENAKKGKAMFEALLDNTENTLFLGRIGRSQLPTSRSTRKPLTELIIKT
ncbi:Nitroreductase family protein [Colwellia chukchiensis]|uniref:Nitroreductase family protein n=1 Tax=Colwellia chukchiensis TaxID=641665 RepID=A0A1H7T5L9_9GAMM|nr:Nitroreductase family protein [Colwellia chukchiensis]